MPQIEILQQLVVDVGGQSALKLIHMFQKDVDKHIHVIQESFDRHEINEDLRYHSHSLKGLCRTYGAELAGQAAHDLQAACDKGDEAEIQNATQRALDIIAVDTKAAVNFVVTLSAESSQTEIS